MLRSSWVVGGLLFPLLAAAAPITPAPEASRKSASAADLRADLVVDPSGVAIYVMNPGGGLDAVSPLSGEILWNSQQATRPLVLIGDQLLAQGPPPARAGVLDLVLLGTADGAPRQTLSMELPAGIWASVDDTLNATFELRAISLGGAPYVVWNHTRRDTKAVAPQPGEELERKTAGAGRVDLLAGRVIPVDPATLDPRPALPAEVMQAAQRWAAAGELSTAPAIAGKVIAATRAVGGRIVLERWNTMGAPLGTLGLVSEPYILELRSADGRYLMVSRRVAPDAWDEYGWTVFDLESGRRLGQVRNPRSHSWFLVQGSTLIYVSLPHARRVGSDWDSQPLMLRAVDIDGGRLVWELPLRDTSYRGGVPR